MNILEEAKKGARLLRGYASRRIPMTPEFRKSWAGLLALSKPVAKPAISNLQKWGKVARTPKLRQDFTQQVIRPILRQQYSPQSLQRAATLPFAFPKQAFESYIYDPQKKEILPSALPRAFKREGPRAFLDPMIGFMAGPVTHVGLPKPAGGPKFQGAERWGFQEGVTGGYQQKFLTAGDKFLKLPKRVTAKTPYQAKKFYAKGFKPPDLQIKIKPRKGPRKPIRLLDTKTGFVSRAGGKVSKNFIKASKNFKDLSPTESRLTMPLTYAPERIEGTPIGLLRKEVIEPTKVSWQNYKDEVDVWTKKVENLKIKPKSDLSRWVQKFGEGRIRLEDVPKKYRQQVENADGWFRGAYRRLLKDVNKVRINTNKTPIPRRKNFYTHFQQLSLLDRVFGGLHDVPDEAVISSQYSKPNSPFNPHELARKIGAKFEDDAVTGFLRYLQPTLKQKHLTPAIVNIRAHNKYLPGNAYIYFNNVANTLAGKVEPLDRVIPLARWLDYSIMWLRDRMAKNAIVGNISTILIQPASIVPTFAETGLKNTLQGHADFLINPTFAYKYSKELKGRIPEVDIDPSSFNKGEKFLASFLEVMDRHMVGGAFNAGFRAGKVKGMSFNDAILYADSVAEKTQASYKKFMNAPVLRSKFGGTLGQFQTFIVNQLNYLGYDILKKKDLIKGLKFLIGALVLNKIYEKTTGRKPFSPQEMIPFAGRGRFGQAPIAQYLSPVKDFLTAQSPEEREAAKKDFKKTLAFLAAMPYGGNQLRKLLEGLDAIKKKGVYTPAGELKFEVKSFLDQIKALTLGRWSTQEAQDYLKETKLEKEAQYSRSQLKKKAINGLLNNNMEDLQEAITSPDWRDEFTKEVIRKAFGKAAEKKDKRAAARIWEIAKVVGVTDTSLLKKVKKAEIPKSKRLKIERELVDALKKKDKAKAKVLFEEALKLGFDDDDFESILEQAGIK